MSGTIFAYYVSTTDRRGRVLGSRVAWLIHCLFSRLPRLPHLATTPRATTPCTYFTRLPRRRTKTSPGLPHPSFHALVNTRGRFFFLHFLEPFTDFRFHGHKMPRQEAPQAQVYSTRCGSSRHHWRILIPNPKLSRTWAFRLAGSILSVAGYSSIESGRWAHFI